MEIIPMFGHHVVKKNNEVIGNIISFGENFLAQKSGTKSSGGNPIGVGVYPTLEIAMKNLEKAHERRRK